MNPWESGSTFPVRGWLEQQRKDAPPGKYLTMGCLVGKTSVEGKSLVEESYP